MKRLSSYVKIVKANVNLHSSVLYKCTYGTIMLEEKSTLTKCVCIGLYGALFVAQTEPSTRTRISWN